MAKCFLSFGDSARAQDLLVFLRRAAQPDPKQSTWLSAYRLSTDSNVASNDLLTISWACYLASTLEDNVTEQLEAVDSLRDKGLKSTWITLALGFSYLQAGSFRRANRLFQARKEQELGSALENGAMELYHAEAAVAGVGDISFVPSLLATPGELQLGPRLTTDLLVGSTKGFGLDEDKISALFLNRRGLSCLAHGRAHDALVYFREACQAAMKCLSSIRHGRKIIYLQPFFNLALLLWVEKRVVEACEVWMSVRDSSWTSLDTHQLASELQKSIKEYMGYVSRMSDGVLVWQPPTVVARRDMLLLDIILLQSALHRGNDGKLVALLQGPGFKDIETNNQRTP
jgi:hypothetical protein